MDNSFEYIVIAVYLLFLLGIGFAFRKFNSNVSDYFRNGCRGTWWLVGASSFMAGISAYTFTGAAGVAYQAGWSVMIIYTANALGFLVNYLWFAVRFRQMRATTAPDLIRDRYNKSTEQFYSWFTLPMGVISTGLTLYSLAIFSSAIFGFQVTHVIVVLGFIVLIYSVTGGSWAIMATDFIQCLIMFVMTILLTVLCLYKLGGIGGLFEQINAQGLTSDYGIINAPERFGRSFTWIWAAAMFLRQTFAANTLESAPRYFSVKDGNEAKKAALLGMILMMIGACIWFIPPMTARIFYSNAVDATAISKPAESAFAITCMNMLPPGMVGLMVVAMFAASMSTMDTGLNRNAAVFIRNIYPALKKLFNFRDLSSEKMLLMSQVFSTLFGIMGIMCAVTFAAITGLGQFELVLLVGALLGVPMAVPLFWGIFVKRVPQWAAACSICFGFAGSLLTYFSNELFGFTMVYQDKVFLIMALSSIGFFVTIPFAKNNSQEYDEKVNSFFKRMNTPVDFEKEVGGANDLSQLKVIGIFTLLIGLFIALLAIPAQDMMGVICPLAVSVTISALGLTMILIGKKSVKKNKNVKKEEIDLCFTEEENLT
jgi:SSS family transporter